MVPAGGWLLAATLVAGIALAGGRPLWAQGLVTIGVGLLWIIWPPLKAPRPALLIVLGLVALAPLAAYFPHGLMSEPAWRESLSRMPAVAASAFLTPQPWLTLHVWLLWMTGVALAAWCALQPWDHYNRDAMARLYTGALAGLAVLALIFNQVGGTPSLWDSAHGFGPFTNRNQWGSVLGMGGIMALALVHQSVRHAHRAGLVFWAAVLAVFVWCVLLNGSRGGVTILLCGGFAYWMFFGIARAQYSYAAVAVSFLLIALALFAIGAGPLTERFVSLRETVESGGDADFRVQFYRITRSMLADAPLTGFGLGNFEFVLPFYLDFEKAFDRRPVHPESSFLWLASEGGWLALMAVGAAFAVLIYLGHAARRGPGTAVRSASLSCAVVLIFNAFFEVSAHRVGSLFPALFLASLALSAPSGALLGPAVRNSLRGGGLVLAGIGTLWMVSALNMPMLPAVQGIEPLRAKAGAAKEAGQEDQAVAILQKCAALRPLDWSIHWSLAVYHLENGRPDAAWNEFRAVAALLPYMNWVIEKEGYFWLPVNPGRAVFAWQEAMRRTPPGKRVEMYAGYLNQAKGNPAVMATLLRLQPDDPEFEFARIRAARERGAKRLPRLLAMTGNLSQAPDHLVEPVMRYMLDNSMGTDLDRMGESSPRLKRLGWRVLVDRALATQRLEEALELYFQFGPRPALPAPISRSDLRTIERAAVLAPMDISTAIAYYQALDNARRKNDAFFQLRRIMQMPDAPAYIWYLAARAAHDRGEHQEAWEFLQTYERKTRR